MTNRTEITPSAVGQRYAGSSTRTEHPTRQCAGVLAVAHDRLAGDHYVVDPDLERVRLLERRGVDNRARVEDDQVREHVLGHATALGEPEPLGG